ncbi:hypothetical protein Aph01nite_71630 [Acrocarpospora phusangensis]|uniref:Uncharacterized protein n=1 Tax=Acrocarpospora phusangensis TaxID=1070424 RepID=A0A919QHF6_9ACTN|nr:hypothetical protein [Acrocarpospora phusangensis]GIH28853.1 hypothetical protein Aph01nite_71630 [Acrocarpospora phusangensis]
MRASYAAAVPEDVRTQMDPSSLSGRTSTWVTQGHLGLAATRIARLTSIPGPTSTWPAATGWPR